MSSKSVDFVVRSDALRKGGGDMVQVQRYQEFLEAKGWDVRIVPFRPRLALRPGAIVHLMNIDRPFEALVTARAARSSPLFVSPIHHALPAVRRMRDGEKGFGLRSVLGKVLREEYREYLAFMARSSRDSDGVAGLLATMRLGIGLISSVRDVWRRVGRVLDGADAVFLLARGEGRAIAADTGWRLANAVLTPNGAPPARENPTPWAERSERLLLVGRIEPRKRQLDFLERATKAEVPATVVGALQQPDSAFGKRFSELISASRGLIQWKGAVDADEVIRLMQGSRVLVNASWVEVQSLVDLEAASSGAWVVGSDRAGNSEEYLGGNFQAFREDDLGEALQLAAELAHGDAPPVLDYPWRWDDASARIEASYESPGITAA